MSTTEIKVPDIGDFKDVPVIEVLVKAGDTVNAEQSLITLESDKATLDVPTPSAGTVKEVKVKAGDKVSEGSVIVLLETAAAEKAEAPAEKATKKEEATPAPSQQKDKPAPVAPTAEDKRESPPASATSTSAIEVKVPDIGDFKDVPVIEVFVKPGDKLAPEQSVITLESEKATLDVPTPAAGIVKEVKVRIGDKVSQGSVILLLDSAKTEDKSAAHSDKPAAAKPAPSSEAVPPPKANTATDTELHMPTPAELAAELVGGHKPHASPSVRSFARELGVDIAIVKGSGPKGRITFDDVKRYVKGVISNAKAAPAAASGSFNVIPWPKIDFSKFGPVEVQPLSRIKKLAGTNLARNWVMIPHVTQFDLADITDLEAHRLAVNKAGAADGVKLTMLAFLIKACVEMLKKFPDFNASLDGQGEDMRLVRKGYFNIGFAADTPQGLVVPVIRDVDQKSVLEIALETAALAKKARDGKIGAAEMQGGCFTISSLGGIGGTAFTPIINAPEVAILGVSKSDMQPRWNGKEFEPRLMLPLSLSYDHRVIDGAAAARFTKHLIHLLADMRHAST